MKDTFDHLLERSRDGDTSARDRLVELVHGDLRRIAAGQLRSERVGHTLQATALKKALKAGVDSGKLVQKGQSFKLAGMEFEVPEDEKIMYV